MDLLVSSAVPAVMKDFLHSLAGAGIFVPHVTLKGVSSLVNGCVQAS